MAKGKTKKATTKKVTPKKTNQPKTESNKMSRQDQMDCSKLIMLGTAVVIILVISYIAIEYFMV